ncbi:MAG: hypothetical protein WC027_02755 [Candidatus Paceibacterota bacterium]
MIQYLNFFFGNRVRAICSTVFFLVFGFVVYFRPELLTRAIAQGLNAVLTGVLTAIEPIQKEVFMIIIMIIGFRIMIRGLKSPSKKK